MVGVLFVGDALDYGRRRMYLSKLEENIVNHEIQGAAVRGNDGGRR
jgi:hypothetical protein